MGHDHTDYELLFGMAAKLLIVFECQWPTDSDVTRHARGNKFSERVQSVISWSDIWYDIAYRMMMIIKCQMYLAVNSQKTSQFLHDYEIITVNKINMWWVKHRYSCSHVTIASTHNALHSCLWQYHQNTDERALDMKLMLSSWMPFIGFYGCYVINKIL